MNENEYNSICEEMRQGLKSAEQLVILSITVIGGLLSWLASTVENISNKDPFIFVMIELIIILYAFSRYLHINERVFNQGSYLVAFHEISSITENEKDSKVALKNGLGWLIYSRKYTPNWGRHGKISGYLLIALILISWAGPIYLLYPDDFSLIFKLIFQCKFQWFTLAICFLITFTYGIKTIIRLFNFESFMGTNMSDWWDQRKNVSQNGDKSEKDNYKYLQELNSRKKKRISEVIIGKCFILLFYMFLIIIIRWFTFPRLWSRIRKEKPTAIKKTSD